MKYSTIGLLILLFLFSCKKDQKNLVDISGIPMDLKVYRFDREFAAAFPEELPDLKEKFPFLFPEQYPDSIWKIKLKDTLQQQLAHEVDLAFGDFRTEESELELFYKHLAYYVPEFKNPPAIITMTSDVDYANRVLLSDSLLLLGLDNYLGPDHRFYSGIDRYISDQLKREYLLRDIAMVYAQRIVPPPTDRTFLAQMIYHGKMLHLAQRLLPTLPETQLIGYSDVAWDWARANEDPIWRYFIERELLYDTDRNLNRRFIDDAPFSKFRLELDRESPGRIGRYMGWQIVEAYVANNEHSLTALLQLPAKQLFLQSKFKPRK